MNKDNIVYLAIVVVSFIFVFGVSWLCNSTESEVDEVKENQGRIVENDENETSEDEASELIEEQEVVVQEPFQVVDDYPRKEFLPGLPYERSGTFSRYVRKLG
jgi:hypothetical protein